MSVRKHRKLTSNHHESIFARIARAAADWSGSTMAFMLAVLLLVVWAVSRPLFDSFDTWQLVINTATTIVTFLMVFLIQRAQNKDAQAIHLKLNELVAAMHGASNRLINAETLTEEELQTLHAHYCKLVELAQKDLKVTESHSVEEAEGRHEHKMQGRRERRPAAEPSKDQPAAQSGPAPNRSGGRKRKKSR
jgi:low affinity Fe/Cu permease